MRGGAPGDRVTVVAAGITVHEALKAIDALGAAGPAVRLIDAYSVKPIDGKTIADAVRATGRLIVVEDHWAEGGLGDATLAALAAEGVGAFAYRHLAVRAMPGSGKPAELLDAAGISAKQIAEAVRSLAG